MTDLDAKITALETALATGALRIESNGEMIIYRSVSDLQKALAYFKGQRPAQGASPAYGSTLVVFGND